MVKTGTGDGVHELDQSNEIVWILTLLALARAIGRERRGGVIIHGGHGKSSIDIILGPN